MIIHSIKVTCPACEECVEIDVSSQDVKIEAYNGETLVSFRCTQCDEYIDREALEKEYI